MFIHHTYDIKAGEKFNPDHCPLVINELGSLQEGMADLPAVNKEDIVISYLKNHSVDMAWMSNNPKVASRIISGSLATSHIEAYFDSCKTNAAFVNDFEQYIRGQFQK